MKRKIFTSEFDKRLDKVVRMACCEFYITIAMFAIMAATAFYIVFGIL